MAINRDTESPVRGLLAAAEGYGAGCRASLRGAGLAGMNAPPVFGFADPLGCGDTPGIAGIPGILRVLGELGVLISAKRSSPRFASPTPGTRWKCSAFNSSGGCGIGVSQ